MLHGSLRERRTEEAAKRDESGNGINNVEYYCENQVLAGGERGLAVTPDLVTLVCDLVPIIFQLLGAEPVAHFDEVVGRLH